MIITNQIKAASKNVKKTGVFRERECICYNISEGKLSAKKSVLALEIQLKKKSVWGQDKTWFSEHHFNHDNGSLTPNTSVEQAAPKHVTGYGLKNTKYSQSLPVIRETIHCFFGTIHKRGVL